MDIKSLFVGQLAGGDSSTHPNYASRPAVTYDLATQQLVYSQAGNIAKIKVPLGRSVSSSGNIITSDENTVILVDTSLGVITLTLPSAVAGDTYYLLDTKAKWGVNKVTLNTNTFFGVSQTYDLKLQSAHVTIKYINTSLGWVVTTSSSPTSAVPGSANPLNSGAATAGTATAYSREDHVHPSDATKAPVANPAFTGTATLNSVSLVVAAPQIDVYNSIVGSPFTWSLPAGAKFVDVYLCGSGGGGASGSKGTGTVALSGGGGGGAATPQHFYFLASQLGATASVTIAAGGSGGAAVSASSTNGNSGSGGAQSTFSSGSISVRSVSPGGGVAGTYSGGGNTVASTNGYSAVGCTPGAMSYANSGSGGANPPSLTAARAVDQSSGVTLPGLAGGSIAAGGTVLAGGLSQATSYASSLLSSSTISPGSIPVPGEPGKGLQIGNMLYAFGGNGGSASITAATNAVSGGAGIYGSGGGGGGAALDSAGNSGAGGKGGDGWCVIVTTF